MRINIVDKTFAHDIGTCAFRTSYPFSWNRSINDCHNVIFTDDYIGLSQYSPSPRKALMIIESRGIQPSLYDLAKQYEPYVDVIFTHDSELLSLYPKKARFKPGNGAAFIGDVFSDNDKAFSPPHKSRLCSFLLSDKQFCPMHSERIKYALEISKSFNKKIDIFMNKKKSFKALIKNKIKQYASWEIKPETYSHIPSIYEDFSYKDALESYMFTISIENYIDKSFFTEKLLSPFAMNCIPIYQGALEASKYFDERGFFQFSTVEELGGIIATLSPSLYENMLPYAIRNHHLVKDYMSIEHYIYSNYESELSIFAQVVD